MGTQKLSKQDQRDFAAIGALEDNMTLLTTFKPNDGGQARICSSKKHQIIGAGGNKGGKTYTGVSMGALSSVPEKNLKGENTGYLCYHRLWGL